MCKFYLKTIYFFRYNVIIWWNYNWTTLIKWHRMTIPLSRKLTGIIQIMKAQSCPLLTQTLWLVYPIFHEARGLSYLRVICLRRLFFDAASSLFRYPCSWHKYRRSGVMLIAKWPMHWPQSMHKELSRPSLIQLWWENWSILRLRTSKNLTPKLSVV